MFNYDCVSFSSSIVNVPYVIILSVSICISSLLVWISINTLKTKRMMNLLRHGKWLRGPVSPQASSRSSLCWCCCEPLDLQTAYDVPVLLLLVYMHTGLQRDFCHHYLTFRQPREFYACIPGEELKT